MQKIGVLEVNAVTVQSPALGRANFKEESGCSGPFPGNF